MKRVLVIACLLLLAGASLLSCGGGDGNEKVYVSSVESTVYHYPWCEWAHKIKESNEVWFATYSEAEEAGYRACRVCKPPSSEPTATEEFLTYLAQKEREELNSPTSVIEDLNRSLLGYYVDQEKLRLKILFESAVRELSASEP